MGRRKARKQGKRSERGGRVSEGKVVSSMKGYRELARRKRIGGREIDSLLQRGAKILHLETTKTCITKPKLEKLWEKYKRTRLASGANILAIRSPCITGPARNFAKNKNIRIV